MTPVEAWQICKTFGTASVLSVGGGNAIVPQLQRETVLDYHWLTASQFAETFAIAQVAPGPSTLLVTLLGFRAAGLAGALLATAAMLVPAAGMMWIVTRLWLRSAEARWHVALEKGIAPIAIGLVAAGGVIIALSVDQTVPNWGTSIVAAVVLSLTRVSPILVVLGGGVIGLMTG